MAVVRDGTLSSLGRDIEVTSEAVMEHMAQRLSFVDPGFSMEVFTDSQLQVDTGPSLTFSCDLLRLSWCPVDGRRCWLSLAQPTAQKAYTCLACCSPASKSRTAAPNTCTGSISLLQARGEESCKASRTAARRAT